MCNNIDLFTLLPILTVLCPEEYGPFPRSNLVGSPVTFSPTIPSPCSCKPERCTNFTSPPTTATQQTLATTNHSQNSDSLPTLYIISPTHSRLTQKVDLTTVCYTFMHVPKLIWIVVEDSDHKSDLVKNVLERCQVSSVHLNAVTPHHYKTASWKPRGVVQRNAGLQWIREHHTTEDCNGVVYFADDDNKYDLRLFVEVRYSLAHLIPPGHFFPYFSLTSPLSSLPLPPSLFTPPPSPRLTTGALSQSWIPICSAPP